MENMTDKELTASVIEGRVTLGVTNTWGGAFGRSAEVSEVVIYNLPWGAAQDEIICAGALQHLRECGSAVVHASAEAALAACRAPVTQIVRV